LEESWKKYLWFFWFFASLSLHPQNSRSKQFQSHVTINGVTFAADLLLKGTDQKEYFYKELTPSNFIAVRLAVFNKGKEEVVLPLGGLRLTAPDGTEFSLAEPQMVAQAVLGKVPATSIANANPTTVQTVPGGSGNPRTDPSDPRYDPRLDPNSPSYDPNDPRNAGQYPPGSYPPGTVPGTYPGSYPTGSYPTGRSLGIPGIVLTPGGNGGLDLSQVERQLAEKDFSDKAHTSEPVLGSMTRDRFLYFAIPEKLSATTGYTLRIPPDKGIPEEVILKF
jgi:hypothetical protein